MAFGNLTAFYLPLPANAGSSLWGTDVRKVLSAAETAPDGSSITDHSTGGNVVRTLDPFSTSTTDGTEANFGFAIQPSDMNSLSGARRFFPAGDHVLQIQVKNSTSVLAKSGCVLHFYAFRVGPAASRTRTQLGTATTSFATANTNAFVTVIVTLALAEIIFEVDETIQYSIELDAPGTAITGELYALRTGHQVTPALDNYISTPKLGVLADTAAAMTGDGTIAGGSGKVLGLDSALTGDATIAGITGATSSTALAATADATVAGATSSVFSTAATLTGDATVAGTMSSVLGSVFTIDNGGGGTTTTQIYAVIE